MMTMSASQPAVHSVSYTRMIIAAIRATLTIFPTISDICLTIYMPDQCLPTAYSRFALDVSIDLVELHSHTWLQNQAQQAEMREVPRQSKSILPLLRQFFMQSARQARSIHKRGRRRLRLSSPSPWSFQRIEFTR